MIKQYEKDGYLIEEYPNGTIVKTAISEPVEAGEQTKHPTVEDRLVNIENALDLILLKQEGLL